MLKQELFAIETDRQDGALRASQAQESRFAAKTTV
jgi:hypothetical protein